MTARRLFSLAFLAALLAGFGCSNDSGGSGGTSGPALACADGGNAPSNVVNTQCGAALDSQTEQVDIVMGGPGAGTTNLRGLNFDVTFDVTKLTFVPAASYTSVMFPGALIAVSPAQPGRVIVSIQLPGGTPAVMVGPEQHVALSLSFQTVPGATFPPTPLAFENMEATSPSVAISFVSATTIAYQ